MPDATRLRDLPPLHSLLAARPALGVRVVIGLSTALLACAVAWAALTEAVLVVPGVGRVRPADGPVRGFLDDTGLRAVAPFGARLAAVAVRDGQRVEQGQELFRLDTSALDERRARCEIELRGLSSELSLSARAALETRSLSATIAARIASEISAARAEERREAAARAASVRAAQVELRAAVAEANRARAVAGFGGAAPADVERALARVDAAREGVRLASASPYSDRAPVLARQREEAEARAALDATRLAGQRLAAERELATRSVECDGVRRDIARAVVRAESGGVVAVAHAAPGDFVGAGVAVVTLTSGARLRVDAAIPTGSLQRVVPGAAARVVVRVGDGEPLVVPGHIRYVSADSEVVALPGAAPAHVYLASLDVGEGHPLRAGMMGQVEVVVGRRSILRLLFERVRYGIRLE